MNIIGTWSIDKDKAINVTVPKWQIQWGKTTSDYTGSYGGKRSSRPFTLHDVEVDFLSEHKTHVRLIKTGKDHGDIVEL